MRYFLYWLIAMIFTTLILYGLIEKPLKLHIGYRNVIIKVKHKALLNIVFFLATIIVSVVLTELVGLFNLNEYMEKIAKGIIAGLQCYMIVIMVTGNLQNRWESREKR